MCIRASEESLFCAASITFLPQKTEDILNYAQRQRATQKTNNAYLHLLQAQVDPRSTLCNWLLNRQFENENSQSLKRPDKCVQSDTVVPLSPQNENKVKSNVSLWLATVTTITANGGIITSSGSSLYRGTQQEYSSKPLKLNIALLNVFLISVYMVDIGICLSPKNLSSVRIP